MGVRFYRAFVCFTFLVWMRMYECLVIDYMSMIIKSYAPIITQKQDY